MICRIDRLFFGSAKQGCSCANTIAASAGHFLIHFWVMFKGFHYAELFCMCLKAFPGPKTLFEIDTAFVGDVIRYCWSAFMFSNSKKV